MPCVDSGAPSETLLRLVFYTIHQGDHVKLSSGRDGGAAWDNTLCCRDPRPLALLV